MKVRNYQELIAWQRAMDLVESVYKVARVFPREEPYALTNQIRRAAVSIPSNIAEGLRPISLKDKVEEQHQIFLGTCRLHTALFAK